MHHLLMYVATKQHCNYTSHPPTPQKKEKSFVSDIPMTLKQGQGHQNWYDYVDPKQRYNHTKVERSRFNSV